jgi:hypothetical protein
MYTMLAWIAIAILAGILYYVLKSHFAEKAAREAELQRIRTRLAEKARESDTNEGGA